MRHDCVRCRDTFRRGVRRHRQVHGLVEHSYWSLLVTETINFLGHVLLMVFRGAGIMIGLVVIGTLCIASYEVIKGRLDP